MSVDVIARAESRIASLLTDAERLEFAALRLAQKAMDCRVGVRDLQNFITMARELAEDETEPQAAMPAQTEPVGAEGVLARQASVESPATNTETSVETGTLVAPGSGDGASDAAPAPAGEESATSPATHSAATPMDEVGIASSSEETPRGDGDIADAASGTGAVPPPGLASIAPESATENADATPQAGGEPHAPPAPKQTVADRILELQAEHPDWIARQFAEAMGKTVEGIRAAARDRGIVLMKAGVGGRPIADLGGKSLRQRIADALDERPGMTAREVAEYIGADLNQVHVLVSVAKLPVRKLTPEEHAEIRRANGRQISSAPISASDATNAPSDATPPPSSTSYVSLPVIPPELRKAPPKAAGKAMFYLRSDNGKYLHQSCQGLVPGPTYAWKGTEAQIFKVREKFPDVAGYAEEAVR